MEVGDYRITRTPVKIDSIDSNSILVSNSSANYNLKKYFYLRYLIFREHLISYYGNISYFIVSSSMFYCTKDL